MQSLTVNKGNLIVSFYLGIGKRNKWASYYTSFLLFCFLKLMVSLSVCLRVFYIAHHRSIFPGKSVHRRIFALILVILFDADYSSDSARYLNKCFTFNCVNSHICVQLGMCLNTLLNWGLWESYSFFPHFCSHSLLMLTCSVMVEQKNALGFLVISSIPLKGSIM